MRLRPRAIQRNMQFGARKLAAEIREMRAINGILRDGCRDLTDADGLRGFGCEPRLRQPRVRAEHKLLTDILETGKFIGLFDQRERSVFFQHDQHPRLPFAGKANANLTAAVLRNTQRKTALRESQRGRFHRAGIAQRAKALLHPVRRIAGRQIEQLHASRQRFNRPLRGPGLLDLVGAQHRVKIAVFPFFHAAMRNALHAKGFDSLRPARIECGDRRVHAASLMICS